MRAIPTRPVEAIEPDPRRDGVVRIVIGGRTALVAPVTAVEAEGVAVGAVLGVRQVERLEAAADLDAAYRTAIRLLERRPFAVKDLARRLRLKGHAADVAQKSIDRAIAAGYLDDARFARFYVDSRSARGRGPARLKRELRMLGVAPEQVEAALAEVAAPEAVASRVEALLARRAAQLAGLPPDQRRRRLLAFLARRGFHGAEVGRLVKRAIGGSAGRV